MKVIIRCILTFLVHASAIITGENIWHIFDELYINFDLIGKIFFAAFALIFIIIALILIIMKDTEAYKKSIKSRKPTSIFFVYIGPVLIAIIVWLIIIPSLMPIFEITSPKENYNVGQLISVKGHGAIPGSEIEVFVIDNLGTTWRASSTFSNMEGEWELRPVYIGNPGERDIGKRYEIYALLKTLSKNYSTKYVRVTRI